MFLRDVLKMFLTVCAPPSNHCETPNFGVKVECANGINLNTYYLLWYQLDSFLKKDILLHCL